MMRLALAIALFAGPLQAGEGAAYLKIPQGARSSAMAGAMAASEGDAEGMWYSPATLPGLGGFELSLSRMAWIGDTKNDFLALAMPLGSTQSQGLGLYGNLIATEDIARDAFGNDGAKFGNSANVLGLAYGISFGPVVLGLGAKHFSQKIASTELQGQAYDLGTQIRLGKGAFRVAAAVQNLGSLETRSLPLGGGEPTTLPLTARYALAAEAKQLGLQGSLEYRMLPESGEGTLCLGTEYAFKAGGVGFALRAGYEGASARIGGLSGLTLGGGFEMAGLVADFAWLPQGVLGNPYRMSLGWRFASDPRFQAPAQPAPKSAGSALKDAEAAYKRATEASPGDYRAWKALGQFYYSQGHKAGALYCFDKVQELKPTPEFKAWLDRYRSGE